MPHVRLDSRLELNFYTFLDRQCPTFNYQDTQIDNFTEILSYVNCYFSRYAALMVYYVLSLKIFFTYLMAIDVLPILSGFKLNYHDR